MTRSSSIRANLRIRSGWAVLLAGVVVVAIFAGYELIERIWLQNVDVETLHLLHRVRGVVASLLAAGVVGWIVVRASPPLLGPSPMADGWTHDDRPTREQRERNYARWFIAMRWVAVLIAAVLAFVVVRVLELLPGAVWWPLIGTISVLAGMNLIYMLLQRRRPLPRFLLPMQAYGDLIILTLLLHFSGGVENPLSPLMLFHVIIAGVVLSRAHCYAVAITGSGLFALLAMMEATGVAPHYSLAVFPHHEMERLPHAAQQPLYVASHVGLHAIILLLAAYFVSTLGDRIRRDEAQLTALAEQALAHRQLVEQALETTATALCVCDQNARPYWTNQRWQTWFGEAAIDALARRGGCGEPAPAGDSLRDGEPRVVELTVPAGDGPTNQRTYQVTTASLGGAESQSRQVVSLAHDITEQQAMQAQLIRAGKLAAVGELAGQVAHEVNNPIAIISAKARLLLENDDEAMPAKVRQELTKITDLADRVAQIAQGLLSYCRPSPATRQPVDLCQPIRAAIHTVDHRAHSLGVTIQDLLPDHLPAVQANPGEMQQVFLNLLLNALDAMPEGGQLTVAGEQRDGDGPRVVFSVTDTGVGIPQTIQEQVFEPFFTTKTDGKGTGLGLSICQGLVRSHGGQMTLSSGPGQGTQVFVELPIEWIKGGTQNA